MKHRARSAGEDIIDFGMGNPDSPTPAHIVDKLVETVRNPRTHRYSTSRGIPGLRRAVAAYYERRHNVTVDPEREVVVNLGSKEGFVNLAQAIVAPGDMIIAPNPTYPIHSYAFIIAGASIRHLPLTPAHDYLRELDRAVRHSVPPPTALILNFPSNPTAQVVDLDFYGRSSISAAATTCSSCPTLPIRKSISTAIRRPPSWKCPAPGISPSSSSRSARPIRCRAGGSALPSATNGWSRRSTHVKSYVDYGAFTPIQVAATAALNGPQDCVEEFRCAVPEAARRSGRRAGGGRVGRPEPAGDHVRLGAAAAALREHGIDGICQTAARRGKSRGIAGHRFRRVWRGPSPGRAGREHAAHPAGGPQHQGLPFRRCGRRLTGRAGRVAFLRAG